MMTDAMTTDIRRRYTIALLFDHMGPYQDPIWSGIADGVREQGANLIAFSGDEPDSRVSLWKQGNVICDLVNPAAIDGLILMSSVLQNSLAAEQITQVCERYAPLPVVSIGEVLEGIPSIIIDNKTEFYRMLTHLIELHGFRRIAFIRGPEGHIDAEERFQVYLNVLEQHHIPFDPDLVLPGNFLHESGIKAVQLLLDTRQAKVEAIVAANDNMAIGACRELAARGILVPGEIAVAGFDDTTEAKVATSPLTTVRQSLYNQGREAARLIFAALRGESLPEKVMLPTELVIRESCGCLSSVVHQAAMSAVPVINASSTDADGKPRAHLLSKIEQAVALQLPEFEQESLAQLLDAFFDEIDGKETNKFLPTFNTILGRTASTAERLELDNSTFMIWQDILSTMRREVFPYLDNSSQLNHADDLIHQGRVMIGESAGNAQAYLRIRANELTATHNTILRRLMATVKVSEIADVLAENLPLFNINHCYLALYDDDTIPSAWSKLILAYDEMGRIELGPGGIRFPSEQLIPHTILRVTRPPFLMARALHFKGKPIGFILIEMVAPGASIHSNAYEDLCEQINSAVNSALLAQEIAVSNQQLTKRADELASANAELERTNAELEKAEKNAEEASKAKSAFLANMSHELRTPLNAIIGYSELIEEDCVDLEQDDFIPDLKKIQIAAKHLLALVNDILDLSKIEAGKMDLYLETINVSHMINEVAVTVSPLIEKNVNRLTVFCSDDVGTLYADLTKVRQIIFNLLSNAAKFTKEGDIRLDVSRRSDSEKDWIVIHVTDTGIGMLPDQISKVFSEFSQADSSTTRKYGGTGLGLAISRHFCQMMGGAISVQSDYGKGSTFTVQIPVLAPPTEPVYETVNLQPVELSPEADTIMVLVIDDDPTVRELIVRFLSKEGFHVETTSGGQEGIQRAKELHPQVIILDVMMPVMDGWAVLSTLKTDPDLSTIPVVMVTMVGDKNMGFALGASDYLIKPVDREQLVGILRKYEVQKTEAQILIVEDDADIRSILAKMLRKEGWDIVEAEHGQMALQQVAQSRPALILLDLMMPKMNGFEFIDELRKTESWRSIPIVVVTAMSLSSDDRLRLTEQVRRVLEKSDYSRETLLEEIRSIVSSLHGNREAKE